MPMNSAAWIVQEAVRRFEADCRMAAARMRTARDLNEVIRAMDVRVEMGLGSVVRPLARGAHAALVAAAEARAWQLCEADLGKLRELAAGSDRAAFLQRRGVLQRGWRVLSGRMPSVLVRVEREAMKVRPPDAPAPEGARVRASSPRP